MVMTTGFPVIMIACLGSRGVEATYSRGCRPLYIASGGIAMESQSQPFPHHAPHLWIRNDYLIFLKFRAKEGTSSLCLHRDGRLPTDLYGCLGIEGRHVL